MSKNTPFIVIASLLGSLGVYCSSTVIYRTGSPIRDAQADPTATGACCSSAPEFTKLAEGDVRVTVPATATGETKAYGPEVDVSGYRQVSVLPEANEGACGRTTNAYTGFRAAETSTWGDGVGPRAGVPIPVLAPIMRIGVGTYNSSTTASCTATIHYVVLGLK